MQPGVQANTAYAGSKGAFPNWYRVGRVTCYLYVAPHTYVWYKENMDDICGNLCSWRIRFILHVACIYTLDNILQKTDFSMGFVLLVSQCGLSCIESFSVSIEIPPGLLEEPPDGDKLACIEALWYKYSRSCKPSIS